MPSYRTPAIVIGRTNFGEADRIIRLLTPEHGKISAVAKGVRKITSRLSGHLELLASTELTLATGHNLDLVTSARLQWYPHQLATSYNRLELAYQFARLIDRTTQERTPQAEIFAHLTAALQILDTNAAGPLIELWFKLRLLALIGYQPELGRCLVCSRHDGAVAYYFDTPRGGLVCQDDTSPNSEAITQPTIKLWRLLCDYPFTTVERVAGAPELAHDTLPLANAFYDHHLGFKT